MNLSLKKISQYSNSIGAAASGLCLLHCLVTPLIFVAQASIAVEHSGKAWWGVLDIIFLVISLAAVYWSTKHTSNKFIKIGLWLSWVALTLIILNEKLHVTEISEAAVYIPTLALIILHIVNRKYYHCGDDNCEVHSGK
ncbi:MAG: MerC domain-containing protein [Bacteroidota bacterium]